MEARAQGDVPQPAADDERVKQKVLGEKPYVLYIPPKRFALPGFLQLLRQKFTLLLVNDDHPSSITSLCNHTQAASCVKAIVGFPSKKLIELLPNLAIIACPSAGFDGVDLSTCHRLGISVTNVPAISSSDVADFAILLMLASSRRLCATTHPFANGNMQIGGRRVGIVGLGNIGRCIAKRAEAFGCSISYFGRSKKQELPYRFHASVMDLAKKSDILFVACVLTHETRHLIDKTVLDALGPQGVLVNIARGSVVKEVDLVVALREGSLGAAALDVFENEPMVPEELITMDNVLLTPHIASATRETRIRAQEVVLANLDAYFSGKPLVTPILM